jgi:uncharacterized membrane protein
MLLMFAGLILFLGVHAFTTLRAPRFALVARLGEGPYKIGYSMLAFAGLLIAGYGYGAWRAAGPAILYNPPVGLRHLALFLMLLASIMIVAAYTSGWIKQTLKHPMLAGVKTWALAHLLANGDVATVTLSLAVLAWAVYARISLKRRAEAHRAPIGPAGTKGDIVALAGGLAVYVFLAYVFHPYVVGVPVMPA